ncbi:hypothetical protein L1887_57779 [Cichorium endivia]|nr:hypothetical protein L1887_57779 [Cichorium endivia]
MRLQITFQTATTKALAFFELFLFRSSVCDEKGLTWIRIARLHVARLLFWALELCGRRAVIASSERMVECLAPRHVRSAKARQPSSLVGAIRPTASSSCSGAAAAATRAKSGE